MTKSQQPSLTIIVLTFNSAHIIKSCLEKLNFEKYKIIVVDNASRDNTAEFVQNNFPQAQLIKLPKNIGYGSGNNVALRQVQTEFALVLNPDAIILEKDIELVLNEMRKNPLAALAGPVVLKQYPLDQNELKKRAEEMEQDFSTIKDCYYEKIDGNFSVRFIIGAALFLKISAFKEIGFFDENFFLYYEDDEFCGRVREKRYQNIIVPNATAFHLEGKSSQISLKTIYKKGWHLSWSKMYWKKIRKGNLRAKRSAFKFVFVYFVKSLFCALKADLENFITNIGKLCGAFSFLIGLKSFKKNGSSRG